MKLTDLKNNAFLKVMSLNSFSIAVKMLSGLVSIKVISVLLGPSALALLGNFKNGISLLKSLSTLGIGKAVVVYTANQKKKTYVLSTAFFTIFIMSVLTGLFSVFFCETLSLYFFKTIEYKKSVMIFGFLLPLYAFQVFAVSVLNGLKQFKNLVLLSIIASLFVLLFSISLIWFFRLEGALLSLAISESIIAVLYVVFFIKNKLVFHELKWSKVSFKFLRRFTSYSLMTFVTALISPFVMLFIRNLIIAKVGMQQAGFWEAINRMSGYYLMFLTTGIGMYYLPKLAETNKESDFVVELKNYFKTFIPLCVLMFVLIFLMRGFLIKAIFSSEFLEIKDLLIYQLFGDFLKIASYAFAQQFWAKKMIKEYVLTEILFFFSFLVLSMILITSFGVKGVLYAYVFSYFIYLVSMLVVFKHLKKISYE